MLNLCNGNCNPEVKAIDLEVKSEGKFTLKSQGYSEDFLLKIVDKLKGENINAELVKRPTINVEINKEVDSQDVAKTIATHFKTQVDKGEIVYSTEDESSSILAEKFGDKAKELYATAGVEHQECDTEFYHTGIKYDDHNRPKYRCGYSCPKCGETGRHYIPFHVTRVSCHKCNTPLVVEPATKKGMGTTDEHRDEHGNYTIAEVIDYTVQGGRY